MSQLARFRPVVDIIRDDNGMMSMQVDWEDCADGEHRYNEDYDEEESIGYTDFCDEAWGWLNELMATRPVLRQYPEPGMIMTPDTTFTGGYAIGAGQKMVLRLTDGRKWVLNPGEAVPDDILPLIHEDTLTKLGLKPAGPKLVVKVQQEDTLVDDPTPHFRRPPHETCAWLLPAAQDIAAGSTVPENFEWPFDRFLPYPTCTNPALVGGRGFGPCVSADVQKACPKYEADAVAVLGRSTEGPVPVTISRRRVGQGTVSWRVEKEGQEIALFRDPAGATAEQAMAYKYFIDSTGHGPVPPEPEAEPEPEPSFLRSLVGMAG